MTPNECQFRAASGGLNDFIVAAAVLGFFAPAQCTSPAIVEGATYVWRAEKDDLSEHELFRGTYSSVGPTVTRTTVLQSSNSNGKVNFSAPPRVRLVLPSQQLVIQEDDGVEVLSSLSIVGGTVTTSVAPALSITQTWNNAGVSFVGLSQTITNTACAAYSLTFDFAMTAGTKARIAHGFNSTQSALWLLTDGATLDGVNNTLVVRSAGGGSQTANYVYLNAPSSNGLIGFFVNDTVELGGIHIEGGLSGICQVATGFFGFSSTNTVFDAICDVKLYRDGAGQLALRNGTDAIGYNVFNSYTDVNNKQGIFIGFAGGDPTAYISAFKAGTGICPEMWIGTNSAGKAVTLYTAGTGRWSINENGHLVPVTDNAYNIGASGFGVPVIYMSGAGTGNGYFQFGPNVAPTYLGVDSNAGEVYVSAGFAAGLFSVYNVGSSGGNYERGVLDFKTTLNVLTIGTMKNGIGATRNMQFVVGGTVRADYGISIANGWTFNSAGTASYILRHDGSIELSNVFAGIGQAAGPFIGISNTGANILLSDWDTVSSFGLLQFGGTTSSFPALKRSSATLETRLADDSARAQHNAQIFAVTDGITAPAATAGLAKLFVDTADGDLKVIFGDGTTKTIVVDT